MLMLHWIRTALLASKDWKSSVQFAPILVMVVQFHKGGTIGMLWLHWFFNSVTLIFTFT